MKAFAKIILVLGVLSVCLMSCGTAKPNCPAYSSQHQWQQMSDDDLG